MKKLAILFLSFSLLSCVSAPKQDAPYSAANIPPGISAHINAGQANASIRVLSTKEVMQNWGSRNERNPFLPAHSLISGPFYSLYVVEISSTPGINLALESQSIMLDGKEQAIRAFDRRSFLDFLALYTADDSKQMSRFLGIVNRLVPENLKNISVKAGKTRIIPLLVKKELPLAESVIIRFAGQEELILSFDVIN